MYNLILQHTIPESDVFCLLVRGYRSINILFIYSNIGVSLTAACTQDWSSSFLLPPS